jgi:tRNA(Ile)-lysidine synthase
VGPHPAVASVRHAVRLSIAGQDPGDLLLVACSGGADSLALAAAAAFEAPRAGLRAGGVVVDHGLQPGSAEVAAAVLATMTGLGLDPALSVRVAVPPPGAGPGRPGPEAAARAARYAVLDRAAQEAGAAAVLLGHTLDDQAETVLLRLARGSGARSLAGMAARSGSCLRPLLELRRWQTRAACEALGLRPWDDPQNHDPAFTRVRVRHELMPALEAALGPGVPEALARTASLLRADADALDEFAAAEAARIRAEDGTAAGWPAAALAGLPAALRRRILRTAALAAGCPPGSLAERHIASLDRLVTGWHGQRGTDLPGGIRASRRYGRLLFAPRVSAAGDPGSRRANTPRSESQRGRE